MMTDREFLLDLRGRIEAYLSAPPPAPPVDVIPVGPGQSLQAAWERAAPGARIELEPGAVYSPFTCTPKGASIADPITVTTRGWKDTGPGLPGLVAMKAQRSNMATIARASTGANVDIPNGVGAGYVSLVGVALQPSAAPAAGGTLVRIGTSTDPDPTRLARHVSLKQCHLAGDRVYGTKRGIEANGADILIDQVWVEDVFLTGQDSQAVCAWSGGHGVTIRNSYLQGGAENIMIGGAKPASVAMQPKRWLIEDCLLHKPDRWARDGVARNVKNLFEVKHAADITVRRTLMVGNWIAAQSGYGIVLTYATQGSSPESRGVKDITLTDVALLKSPGAVQISGYSYYADSNNGDKLERVTLEGLYFVQGNGTSPRILMLSNVLGRHDLAIRGSVFLHASNAILTAEYGKAWSNGVVVPGGPMQGLTIARSVFSRTGTYAVTAPGGVHYGGGLGTFVNGDLIVDGNLFGSPSASFLANMNKWGSNQAAASGEIEARFSSTDADGLPVQTVLDYQRFLPEA